MKVWAAELLQSAICKPWPATASPPGTSTQWPPPCGEIRSKVGYSCARAPAAQKLSRPAARHAAIRTNATDIVVPRR